MTSYGKRLHRTGAWMGILVIALLALAGCGQGNYPAKDISLNIPWAAGGGSATESEVLARLVGPVMGKSLIMDFKPGGGGTTGTAEAAQARPDGYTLHLAQTGPLLLQPLLDKRPYSLDDFEFIAQTSVRPLVLAVKGNARWNNLKEFVADAQARPGQISISYSGIGSGSELPVVALMSQAGVKLKLVPFNGGAPARTALLGGHVDATSTGTAGLLQLVKSRQLKVLAIFTPARFSELPDVPTAREQGFDVNFPIIEAKD